MADEHDELEKLSRKPEVFAPDGPFEVLSEKMVPGPYWAEVEETEESLSSEQILADQEAEEGFDKKFPVDRRNFLRFMGLGVAATATSCVRRPVERAVSHVNQPVDHVVGASTYYATTCKQCPASCGVLAKTKEGRLVKVEGHHRHSISQGALCSLGQAQTQGLYHPERLQAPMSRDALKKLSPNSWNKIFKELGSSVQNTKKVAIFTGGSTGHRKQFFEEFLERLGAPKENLFTWEPNALIGAIQEAHEIGFNRQGMPRVELSRAKFLVGVGTDFQDSGVSPVYQTKGFSFFHALRDNKKNEFVQFESHLTLTGAKADKRYVIPPCYELSVLLLLLEKVSKDRRLRGDTAFKNLLQSILADHKKKMLEARKNLDISEEELTRIAKKLLSKDSLVLAGSTANSSDGTLIQIAALLLNYGVGAYGTTLEFNKGWLSPVFETKALKRFEKSEGDFDVLFLVETNPLFTLPDSWKFRELVKKAKRVVSIQYFPNETDELAHYALPSHHPLEAWGDSEAVKGFLSIQQPVMRPTTESRQAEDIFLWILAACDKSLPYSSYKAYLKKKWEFANSLLTGVAPFENTYKKLLATGFTGKLEERSLGPVGNVRNYFQSYVLPQSGLKLVVPYDTRFLDGRGSHLPVLQEIGDGLSSIAWDSWVSLSPERMKKMGLKKNQKVEIQSGVTKLELATYPMPGLHDDAVVIYRGNGHTDERSTISYKNGENPLLLLSKETDSLSAQPVTYGEKVELTALTSFYRLAAMQKHSDLMNRKDIIKEYSVDEVNGFSDNQDLDDVPDLYPKLKGSAHSPYRWGMAIDLDLCNGCGACMTACSIENNVPQVGREQIILGRSMHWVRRDRYFSGDAKNPKVSFQPVMCQHCNHAPCEPVCPVFATTHEPEGLNAMTYNRCVGTRYCANACPYKVRRFNWWTHKWGEMAKEAYSRNPRASNPDVTVRTRGVMEKCSLCVGRIRDKKHLAKKEGRDVADGEIKTACQQTCPTGAIVFGNLNDPQSEIAKLRRNGRAYLLLGADPKHKHYGLKTLPNVNYLAKVSLEASHSQNHSGGVHDVESTGGHHG